MFYPFGDYRRRCAAILHNRDIRFLVNSRLLFDHLVQDGLDNIAEKGMCFEPAFPVQIFHPRRNAQEGKLRFFFYARINNLRNLFHLGIEVIEQAIAQKILDLDRWEIILVGKDIPPVTFRGGYTPHKYENLNWSEYADLMGTIDLGLTLMYTPHPSYLPFDLAASGAVVVTNRYANKRALDEYSNNILCADLDREALVGALREATGIALDRQLREKNYLGNRMCTDWRLAFDGILKKIARDVGCS